MTIRQFEIELNKKGVDLENIEMNLKNRGHVKKITGYHSSKKHSWDESGICVCGRKRVPELDINVEPKC